MTKSKNQRWIKVVNLLGALGYIGVAIQWLFVFALIGLPHLESSRYAETIFNFGSGSQVQTEPDELVQTDQGLSSSLLSYIFAAIVVIILAGLMGYYLIKGAGNQGSRAVRASSNAAAKLVVAKKQHKKPTPQQIKKLSIKLSWSVKLILVVSPVLPALIPAADSVELGQGAIVGIAAVLALMSFAWFLAQFVLARLTRVSPDEIW